VPIWSIWKRAKRPSLAWSFRRNSYFDEEKISLLAPIGAGMLGHRVGDEFEWQVPDGVRRVKVMKVHYQPEAAGDFTR
jgi:regulator of nucleoside diphosphate kinase